MANSAKLAAEPGPIALDWAATALLIIDMQRDFMEPGGFGETLGNDVSQLARAVEPIAAVLKAARDAGMLVVHTREGHLPDLSDAPPAKIDRGAPSLRIGDPGPMGRILIRGEAGHDIIPELYPLDGEIVIDKPGKGAFYATELGDLLQKHGIENLLVCGVTTEVCVNTTVREANDRGYRCVVLADGRASYFPEFHEVGLKMIKTQVLGAIGVFVIERDFVKASAFAFSGAVMTYFGFMHGEAVGVGGGLGVTPAVALAYAVVAVFLYARSGAPAPMALPAMAAEPNAVPAE